MTDSHDHFQELDPELEVIWKKRGLPKLFFPRPDDMARSRHIHALGTARFMKSDFVKQTLGENAACSEEDRPVVVRDGSTVTVRIYRPTTQVDDRPVMLYAHSSGGCLGSLDTDAFVCRLLCMRLNMIIVSVDYRLAPEWPYQTCTLDTYDVMKWVSANAHTFGGDLAKGFLAGGTSAGGNFANAAAILAREDGMKPALTGHFLMFTGMPHRHTDKRGNSIDFFSEQLGTGSFEKYKNCPISPPELNSFYADLGSVDATSPLFTPFNQKDFSRLGPLYYQVAGRDIWKDSALLYSNLVREAGGKTKIDVYPGVPHLWWAIYPQLSINKKWARDLVDGVDWLLKQNGRSAVNARL